MEAELNAASGLMNRCIYESARIALDQTEYQKKDDLSRRFDDAKAKLKLVKAQTADKATRLAAIEDFFTELRSLDGPVTEFDPVRFSRRAYCTQYGRDDVRAAFGRGTEIRA